MPSDLSTLDLATINAVRVVIVTALRKQCCQWEQDSADAAANSRLSNAVMLEHWAFAADLLASKVSTEFTILFGKALDARFGVMTSTTNRSSADQMLDALTLEVASAQEEPELVTA